jgi:hypothetical protein
MAEPLIAIDHMGKQGEKLLAIAVVSHDVLPSIPSTGDRINSPVEFKTKRTRHDAGGYPSHRIWAPSRGEVNSSRLLHTSGGATDAVVEYTLFNVDSFHHSVFNHHRIAL